MKRLWCWIVGHRLYVVHSCSRQAQHVACLRCEGHYGVHHGMQAFISWSPDLCVCGMIDEAIEAENRRKRGV